MAEIISILDFRMIDMANRTFDLAKGSIPSASRSRRISSSRWERCVTAISKAFWENAELNPFLRIVFSSVRIVLSFLSFFTSCIIRSLRVLRIRISSFTSAVKVACIRFNNASLSLFGLPYRNTLFVTDVSKELSFLHLDLGMIFSFLYDFREYTPYILSMRYFSKNVFHI